MAFDAFYMGCVLQELKDLGECRVEKIHQPARDTVILLLKTREGRERLLLGLNPTAPRLHLTATSPENPAQPPMFCMLLRKHLTGARLTNITQLPMERCARLTFACIDEMGDPVEKTLVVELMGRTCNLYLLSPDGRILDCLRRIGLDESSHRSALPGMFYQNPEPVEKINPIGLEKEDYVNLLAQPGADLLSDRLMDTLGGLSPLICREAALFAGGSVDTRLENLTLDAVAETLSAFFREHLQHPVPHYTCAPDGTPKQFAFCPIHQYGDCRKADSFSGLLDSFYAQRDKRDSLRQKSQAMRKTVQNLCARLTRKLAIQEKELLETYDRERLRQLGDILTANIHRITKGQTTVEAEDFYDENMAVISIPLSPILSPQQNAAKFYKDYTRMKNAEKELSKQLALGREELGYLQSVLDELNRAQSDPELDAIRRELHAGGYVKADSAKKMKAPKVAPMRLESTDGFTIYVGRNNQQNDELTFRFARKDDLWLHAQKVHGSHVIIACNGQTPPDDTVTQAAQLAAFHSEAGVGQNSPVDITPVRQVKKLPGAKPGMVIYHSYRTVIVNPYADIVVDPLNAEKKDD